MKALINFFKPVSRGECGVIEQKKESVFKNVSSFVRKLLGIQKRPDIVIVKNHTPPEKRDGSGNVSSNLVSVRAKDDDNRSIPGFRRERSVSDFMVKIPRVSIKPYRGKCAVEGALSQDKMKQAGNENTVQEEIQSGQIENQNDVKENKAVVADEGKKHVTRGDMNRKDDVPANDQNSKEYVRSISTETGNVGADASPYGKISNNEGKSKFSDKEQVINQGDLKKTVPSSEIKEEIIENSTQKTGVVDNSVPVGDKSVKDEITKMLEKVGNKFAVLESEFDKYLDENNNELREGTNKCYYFEESNRRLRDELDDIRILIGDNKDLLEMHKPMSKKVFCFFDKIDEILGETKEKDKNRPG